MREKKELQKKGYDWNQVSSFAGAGHDGLLSLDVNFLCLKLFCAKINSMNKVVSLQSLLIKDLQPIIVRHARIGLEGGGGMVQTRQGLHTFL